MKIYFGTHRLLVILSFLMICDLATAQNNNKKMTLEIVDTYVLSLLAICDLVAIQNNKKEMTLKIVDAHYRQIPSPIGQYLSVVFEIVVEGKSKTLKSIVFDSLQFENKMLAIDENEIKKTKGRIKIVKTYKEYQKDPALGEFHQIQNYSPFLSKPQYENVKLFYRLKGKIKFLSIKIFNRKTMTDIPR